MSATDELRRLLDERGVEWWQSANTLGCVFTRWYSPLFSDEVVAMENGEEGLVLFDHFVTSEQAIDATLGRGTCRDVGRYAFVCSVCGWASDEPHHVFGGFWPKYCPECGRAVVE